jgi:hypothetical protein
MQVNWFLPLSLCAAVTIVVKKRLVNSITFFIFCRQRWRRRQHGGSGSMAAAASLAAEAAAWRKRNFSSSSSPFGNAAAAWWWQQQQRCVGSGSMAYADNNFNCHNDDDDWLLIVPLLQGRGEGWVRGLAACVAGGSLQWTVMTIAMVIVWAKKGLNKEKGENELKDGFVFFILSDFVIVFWLIFFNAGQLISAVVAACCCYHRGEKKVSQ